MMIQYFNSSHPNFKQQLKQITKNSLSDQSYTEQIVKNIIHNIKQEGNQALIKYTQELDLYSINNVKQLYITKQQIKKAIENSPSKLVIAIKQSANRIQKFHEKQKAESWQYTDEDEITLGQRITAIESVGIYVPGGKANYPSSVLMNAIPAKIAGVKRIVMVTPKIKGKLDDSLLVAADVAGVDEIITIGGAQAIAALAYGTENIQAVDKIVGPGNQYVTMAKRLVFGDVGIDMLAGPSEILIITDGSTPAQSIAADMLAQAEHDEQAQSIVLSTNASYLKQITKHIYKQLEKLKRKLIIEKSLQQKGALIHVKDLQQAVEISNYISPEHLEIATEDPDKLLEKITNAGAIFLGDYSCETFGDYCAGPNHVLPTNRNARFSSPLGVYDFQKRSSIIKYTKKAANKWVLCAKTLAQNEKLQARAKAATIRCLNPKK